MPHLDLERGTDPPAGNEPHAAHPIGLREGPLPYPLLGSTPIPSVRSQPSVIAPSISASIPGLPPYPIDDTIGMPIIKPVALQETTFELSVILEEPPPFVDVRTLKLNEPSKRQLSQEIR
jgi:hypothetical protein